MHLSRVPGREPSARDGQVLGVDGRTQQMAAIGFRKVVELVVLASQPGEPLVRR
ncbi:MAG: hypothetical protein ACRDOV_08315 [Streptomyces sp.]